MSEARQYFLPATLATLLHVAIVAVAVMAASLPGKKPITPLRLQATLVQEVESMPTVTELPEPEPEPVVEEPPPPEPDETARIAAEEAKRLEDARIEQERLARLAEAEAEKQRKAVEERKQREAEEAERKRREAEEAERRKREDEARRKREEEERLERQRAEAERQRQEEIERQRRENERKRQEAEQQLLAALDEEEDLNRTIASGAQAAYVFAIQQKIERNWVKPASAQPGLNCTVSVTQLQGGEVVNVSIRSCNGDAAVQRSIEAAVRKASPLPDPSDPRIFERNLNIIFKPEQ